MDGTYFDSHVIRAFVPAGWMAFYGTDSSGRPNPKKLHIYKDARRETDIFTRAGITVCYFGPKEYYFSPKGFYDDVRDIEPFNIGEHTYSGYTCKSLGYPYTMLECRENGAVLQVMVLMQNGDNVISLDDADVTVILSSIQESTTKDR